MQWKVKIVGHVTVRTLVNEHGKELGCVKTHNFCHESELFNGARNFHSSAKDGMQWIVEKLQLKNNF